MVWGMDQVSWLLCQVGLGQSGLPEGTPLYALDKYVQLQRVCFLSAFDLEKVIDIDHIVNEIGLVFFFRLAWH